MEFDCGFFGTKDSKQKFRQFEIYTIRLYNSCDQDSFLVFLVRKIKIGIHYEEYVVDVQ